MSDSKMLPCICGSKKIVGELKFTDEPRNTELRQMVCQDCQHTVNVEILTWEDNKQSIMVDAWNIDVAKDPKHPAYIGEEPITKLPGMKVVDILPDGEWFVGMTDFKGILVFCTNKHVYELTDNGLEVMQLEFVEDAGEAGA